MSSVSCSICWDIVTSTCIASYIACGHVYHHHCLDKWLKTSKTCPECRNAAFTTKRIYLNLVPDPEIEVLNLELTKTTKKFEFAAIDNEIQGAIIKQLEKQLSAKDELLLLSAKQNDELKSNSNFILHQRDKLKLELELQEKQQLHLTSELSDVRNQLQASQAKNIEITSSTVTLKEYYREQVMQISDLHAQILDLTERLDQFRSMFAATDNKLQAQLQANQVMEKERDSLLSRNTHLYQKMYSLKLQVGKNFSRKIKNKYNGLLQSSSPPPKFLLRRQYGNGGFPKTKLVKSLKNQKPNVFYQCRAKTNEHLKIKLIKSKNLKMKLVKSKLNWMCLNS
ncbi:hypothetical protein HA402_004863 [Bradysia odoriphaga]|nr:hypothetical protein HA402_004863 [Bradysia odoriphaga]